MAEIILHNKIRLTKYFCANIEILNRKMEFSMKNKNKTFLDVISPKKRLAIPFSYKWLKFKTGLFGLILKKGVIK